MQDPGYEFPRITLLGSWVNRGNCSPRHLTTSRYAIIVTVGAAQCGLREQGGSVYMRRIILLLTTAALMAAMAMATAVPAAAVPSPDTRHGTCDLGGPSVNSASGCAGNIGGFIDTHNMPCKEINRGPFNKGFHSCP